MCHFVNPKLDKSALNGQKNINDILKHPDAQFTLIILSISLRLQIAQKFIILQIHVVVKNENFH